MQLLCQIPGPISGRCLLSAFGLPFLFGYCSRGVVSLSVGDPSIESHPLALISMVPVLLLDNGTSSRVFLIRSKSQGSGVISPVLKGSSTCFEIFRSTMNLVNQSNVMATPCYSNQFNHYKKCFYELMNDILSQTNVPFQKQILRWRVNSRTTFCWSFVYKFLCRL